MTTSFSNNNLATQSSGYLNRLKEQPIYWQPWDLPAIQHAREQNKPILLSIGYSTCHACQLMDTTTYSDAATLAFLNEHFVSIKVDREQHPDVDLFYQQAHQVLNHRPGGWPLTVCIEPNSLQAVFVGTSFERQSNQGMPSLLQVLTELETIFREQPEEISAITKRVAEAIDMLNQARGVNQVEPQINRWQEQLLTHADQQWGGLKGAPKFPQTAIHLSLLQLLVLCRPTLSEQLYQHLMLTAQSYARIGLRDQLDGGFFHATVDDHWSVPQFEKRLYDNALMTIFFSDLAHFNKVGAMADVARQTAAWMMKNLSNGKGGFYQAQGGSQQASIEYFSWQKHEIAELVGEDDWPVAELMFGLKQPPNLHDAWHLHQWYDEQALAKKLERPLKQIQWSLEPIKQTLLIQRSRRQPLECDQQAITASNAMAVTALLKSGSTLNDPQLIEAAYQTLDYLRMNHWHSDQLYRTSKHSNAALPGLLDDHVALLQAIHQALEYQWDDELCHWAKQLIEQIVDQFSTGHGLKYSTSKLLPTALLRFEDNNQISSNALACQLIYRFGLFEQRSDWLALTNELARSAQFFIQGAPLAHSSMMVATEQLSLSRLVIIRGSQLNCLPWQQQLTADYRPQLTVWCVPPTSHLPEHLDKLLGRQSEPVACVIDQHGVSEPLLQLSQLTNYLAAT